MVKNDPNVKIKTWKEAQSNAEAKTQVVANRSGLYVKMWSSLIAMFLADANIDANIMAWIDAKTKACANANANTKAKAWNKVNIDAVSNKHIIT
jgi:hypothetical protein